MAVGSPCWSPSINLLIPLMSLSLSGSHFVSRSDGYAHQIHVTLFSKIGKVPFEKKPYHPMFLFCTIA